MNEDILSIASDIVDKARRLGAGEVDAYVVSSTESSVQVRRGAVERVIDAGSHAVGIRVIKDKRTAICSTADPLRSGTERGPPACPTTPSWRPAAGPTSSFTTSASRR